MTAPKSVGQADRFTAHARGAWFEGRSGRERAAAYQKLASVEENAILDVSPRLVRRAARSIRGTSATQCRPSSAAGVANAPKRPSWNPTRAWPRPLPGTPTRRSASTGRRSRRRSARREQPDQPLQLVSCCLQRTPSLIGSPPSSPSARLALAKDEERIGENSRANDGHPSFLVSNLGRPPSGAWQASLARRHGQLDLRHGREHQTATASRCSLLAIVFVANTVRGTRCGERCIL
jgi:hypothetical protein